MSDNPSKNRLSFGVTSSERTKLEANARADDRTTAQWIRKQLGLTALTSKDK